MSQLLDVTVIIAEICEGGDPEMPSTYVGTHIYKFDAEGEVTAPDEIAKAIGEVKGIVHGPDKLVATYGVPSDPSYKQDNEKGPSMGGD